MEVKIKKVYPPKKKEGSRMGLKSKNENTPIELQKKY